MTLTVTDAFAGEEPLKVVGSVLPGTGQARLWIDGQSRAGATAVNGALPNGFTANVGDALGAIGQVNGSISSRVPGGDATNLVNCEVQGPLRFYKQQLPHQFLAF